MNDWVILGMFFLAVMLMWVPYLIDYFFERRKRK